MKVQGITALMLTLSGTTCGFHAYALEPGMPASTACTATNPKGGTVENDSLAVFLPDTDTLIFKPGGPGFVDVDGALGIKFGWDIRKKGTLVVTGRRLDGSAPPARAYFNRSYDDYAGGMSLFLLFPTPGCWEITGAVANANLTFVVQVGKVGDGPSWRMRGPPAGSRVTGGSI